MRKALLSAQKMANEITEEAKLKCEELRIKAQTDYENNVAAPKDNIKNGEEELKLREETNKLQRPQFWYISTNREHKKGLVTDGCGKL